MPSIAPGVQVPGGFGRPVTPSFRPGLRVFPSRPLFVNRGVVPVFGFPYAPVVSPVGPYYYAPSESPSQPVVLPDYQSPGDLTIQIEQLSQEIRQLRNEITEVRAKAAPQPEFIPAVPAPPSPPPVPVVLVFKTGRAVETHGYAIIGTKLWIIGDGGATEFALSDLDVAATKAENLKRGNTFRAP